MNEIKAGATAIWDAIYPPPSGWVFMKSTQSFLSHNPVGIVAIRDGADEPILPEEYVIWHRQNTTRQGRMSG